LRIVFVSSSDLQGGAARAAFRLHEALLQAGHDSCMFVARKSGDHQSINGPDTAVGKVASRIAGHLDAMPKRRFTKHSKTPFSVARLGLPNLLQAIDEFDPDIVHLHWINGGFVTPRMIARINRPIVWSLHDMWPFTGGCHYNNEGCTRYQTACGSCPVLGSHRESDLSRRIWKRKRRAYSNIEDLTIVGLSHWLANEARNSSLFQGRPVVNLPNPIDTTVFRPVDRHVARKLWNLPQDAKVVLFGAMSATSDRRKGYDLLIDALQLIDDDDVHLCVFGATSGESDQLAGLPVHFVGRLHDDVSLVTLYSAADVMVVPSRQENLSNAIMESMSCGTPVIAFDIGGNGDMIDHQTNGFLARPYESSDLAEGIRWALAEQEKGNSMCEAAREKTVESFAYPAVVRQYEDLYKQILADGSQYRNTGSVVHRKALRRFRAI
jgi:glycosyltransferase involved in cell wall biosynthesis